MIKPILTQAVLFKNGVVSNIIVVDKETGFPGAVEIPEGYYSDYGLPESDPFIPLPTPDLSTEDTNGIV